MVEGKEDPKVSLGPCWPPELHLLLSGLGRPAWVSAEGFCAHLRTGPQPLPRSLCICSLLFLTVFFSDLLVFSALLRSPEAEKPT